MKQFYVHDADGRILRYGSCQDGNLDAQAESEAETVVEGEADFRTHYVGEKGELVEIPEQPSSSHEFDWKAKAWVPNPELAWEMVRVERQRLLRESDWTMLPDVPLDGAQQEVWRAYRQALRDITTQPDPHTVAWPASPADVATVDTKGGPSAG